MKISPVLVFVGGDLFQIRLNLEEIRSSLFPNGTGGLNDDTFDVKQKSIDDILDLCNTLPMLASTRLVILKGLEKLGENEQLKFLSYAEKACPQTVLVGVSNKLDKRTRFYKSLDKANLIRDVIEPKLKDMPFWLEKLSKKQCVELAPEAKRALVDAIGTNLSLMDQQLEKLAIYIHPEKVVPSRAVAELVLDTTGDTIFAWTDQVVEGKRPEAVKTLNFLFDQGSPGLVLVAMLARHIRLLMRTKDLLAQKTPFSSLASELGLPPFVVNRYVDQSKKFTLSKLVDFFGDLAELDHDLKSTGIAPKLLLERAIRAL